MTTAAIGTVGLASMDQARAHQERFALHPAVAGSERPKGAEHEEVHVGGSFLHRILHKYRLLRPIAGVQDYLDSKNAAFAERRFAQAISEARTSHISADGPVYEMYGGLCKTGGGLMGFASDSTSLLSFAAGTLSVSAFALAPATEGLTAPIGVWAHESAEGFESLSSMLSNAAMGANALYADYEAVGTQSGKFDKATVINHYARNNLDAINAVPIGNMLSKAAKFLKHPSDAMRTIQDVGPFVGRVRQWVDRAKGWARMVRNWRHQYRQVERWIGWLWKIPEAYEKVKSMAESLRKFGAFSVDVVHRAGQLARRGARSVAKTAHKVMNRVGRLARHTVDEVADVAHTIWDRGGSLIKAGGDMVGHAILENREWIGDTLRESGEVFKTAALITGITAGALAITGIGAPVAAGLATASAAFSAAAIAARAWYSTALSVGTIDGSVPEAVAMGEAKGAVIDLGKFVAGESAKGVLDKSVEAASRYAGSDAVSKETVTIVGRLNRVSEWLKRITRLNLKPIVQDAKLALRLKVMTMAYKAADVLDQSIDLFKEGLGKIGEWAKAGAEKAWGAARSAGSWLANKASRAWNFGKRAAVSAGHLAVDKGKQALHTVGSFALGLGHKAADFAGGLLEKLHSAPAPHDGELTGPFYPDDWKGLHLDPAQATEAQRKEVLRAGGGLFVNGIRVDFAQHVRSAQELARATGRPIIGVYNATEGALKDLLQCATDKLFDLVPNKATAKVKELILELGDAKKHNGGLNIYAHSQGSIIVSEALRQAKKSGADLRNDEITTFGNAAWSIPSGAKAYHNYVFDSDLVPTAVGSASILGRLAGMLPLGLLGMRSTAQDTTVLHHAGGGIRPHATVPDPLMENGKEKRDAKGNIVYDKMPGYFSSLKQFQEKEQRFTTPTPGFWGGLGRGMSNAVGGLLSVPRSFDATAFALLRGAGSGLATATASGYGGLDRGIRALPSMPGMKPNTLWGGMDDLLRWTGNKILQGGELIGRGADAGLNALNRVQRSGHGDHPDVDPVGLRADLLREGGMGFMPDTEMRRKLEGHISFDLSAARLHRGPAAAKAASALSAEAFTIGRDVFFGEGKFDPATGQGLGLIAHELTHVGQQTGAVGNTARFFTSSGGDTMEREAQQVGERVMANVGRRGGLFVEDYVRHYEGADGEGVSRADQTRLDHISLLALQEAERLLVARGMTGSPALQTVEIDLALDLTDSDDQSLARMWAEAIVSAVSAMSVSETVTRTIPPLIQRAPKDSPESTPAGKSAPAHKPPVATSPQSLYQMLHSVKSIQPAAGQRGQFTMDYGGKTVAITSEQRKSVIDQVRKALKSSLTKARNKAENVAYRIKLRQDLKNDAKIISWFSETTGGVRGFLDKAQEEINKALVAANQGDICLSNDDFTGAAHAMINCDGAADVALIYCKAYEDGTEGGAQAIVQSLTAVKETCIVIDTILATVATAGAAGAVGLEMGGAAATANAIAVGAPIAINVADATTKQAIGMHVDWLKLGIDSVVQIVFARIGGKIGERVMKYLGNTPVMQVIIRRLGKTAWEGAVRSVLAQEVITTLTFEVDAIYRKLKGEKITWTQLCHELLTQLTDPKSLLIAAVQGRVETWAGSHGTAAGKTDSSHTSDESKTSTNEKKEIPIAPGEDAGSSASAEKPSSTRSGKPGEQLELFPTTQKQQPARQMELVEAVEAKARKLEQQGKSEFAKAEDLNNRASALDERAARLRRDVMAADGELPPSDPSAPTYDQLELFPNEADPSIAKSVQRQADKLRRQARYHRRQAERLTRESYDTLKQAQGFVGKDEVAVPYPSEPEVVAHQGEEGRAKREAIEKGSELEVRTGGQTIQLKKGVTLYKIGTTGTSHGVESQFWMLENPLKPGVAERYGIPPENLQNADFVITAELKADGKFITRRAADYTDPKTGKTYKGVGIEVVVPPDGVKSTGFVSLGEVAGNEGHTSADGPDQSGASTAGRGK
jgi:hypothetical protein